MIRPITEAAGFVVVCSIVDGFVDNWIPFKQKLDSNLDYNLHKLYSQSESIQSEFNYISKKLSQNYAKATEAHSTAHVKLIDVDEFFRNVMDNYDAIESDIIQPESNEEDYDLGIQESFRIIPKKNYEKFLLLSPHEKHTSLHSLLGIRANYESKLVALNAQFQLQQNRVSAMCDNLTISELIGPDRSVIAILSKIVLMIGAYTGYCRIVNRYMPLGDSSGGRPFPPLKRLPFGRGIAGLATAFTVFTATGIYASYSRRFHPIEAGTSEVVTGIPSVWPGATITDPWTWQRFFIYVVNEPIFESVLVQRMLFRRLMATGPTVVAYSLTAAVSALCFAGDRDTNAVAAVMNLNEGPALLSAAGFTILCSSMYHATGSLLLPLCMQAWRHLAVHFRDCSRRTDVQFEQLGLWVFLRSWAVRTLVRAWEKGPQRDSTHPLVEQLSLEAAGFSSSPAPSESVVLSSADMADFCVALQHGLWTLEQQWQPEGSNNPKSLAPICRKWFATAFPKDSAPTPIPALFIDVCQSHLDQIFPNGLTLSQVNRYLAFLLAQETPAFLAQLDVRELCRLLSGWKCIKKSDPEVESKKERLLDLLQEYHSKVLEADDVAAAEVARGIRRVFLASLAGRPATEDDLSSFQRGVTVWRETVVRRSLTSFLANHGLTHRRFRMILSDAASQFEDVRELDQSWVQYLGSEKFKKRWKIAFENQTNL